MYSPLLSTLAVQQSFFSLTACRFLQFHRYSSELENKQKFDRILHRRIRWKQPCRNGDKCRRHQDWQQWRGGQPCCFTHPSDRELQSRVSRPPGEKDFLEEGRYIAMPRCDSTAERIRRLASGEYWEKFLHEKATRTLADVKASLAWGCDCGRPWEGKDGCGHTRDECRYMSCYKCVECPWRWFSFKGTEQQCRNCRSATWCKPTQEPRPFFWERESHTGGHHDAALCRACRNGNPCGRSS